MMATLDAEAATIDRLPDNCILTIFDHLPEEDILALKLVSKHLSSLSYRSLRMRNVHNIVEPKTFVGLSVTTLELEYDVDQEMVEEICDHCPNLKTLSLFGISCESFSNIFFRKMLSQLDELSIFKIFSTPNSETSETSEFRDDIKVALQCCDKLKSLALGSIRFDDVSDFEPIFQLKFPKLRRFQINLDFARSSKYFTHFLKSHSEIRSLHISHSKHNDIDLSAVLCLQHLEELFFRTFRCCQKFTNYKN